MVDAEPGQCCSNCGTNKTPLWRRAPNGTLICNACGLYLRSNNVHRPVNLKKSPNLITNEAKMGSCSGDGRCNGTGGSVACKGCPAYNNRLAAKPKAPCSGSTSPVQEPDTTQVKQEDSYEIEISNDSIKSEKPTPSSDDLAIACFNCSTTITPLWRRDDSGNTICNACGLYYKLHGKHRPIKMKKATIKRRKRNMDDKKQKITVLDSKPNSKPSSTGSSDNITNMKQNGQSASPVPGTLHSGFSQQYFPPYNGIGRRPNGPGPLPGPSPATYYSLPFPNSNYNNGASNRPSLSPLNKSPNPLPNPGLNTYYRNSPLPPADHINNVSEHFHAIKLPSIRLDSSSPTSPAMSPPPRMANSPLRAIPSITASNLPRSQPTSNSASDGESRSGTPQSPPQRDYKPINAIDFTGYKSNKISIGGLLNEK